MSTVVRSVRIAACIIGLWVTASTAQAGLREDCNQDLSYEKTDLIIRACSDVIQGDRNAGWAYGNRGRAYAIKGDYDRAFADYNEAIKLDPGNIGAYKGRAYVYERIKEDYGPALSDLSEVIRLNPHSPGAYSDRAYVHVVKGDYDRAIADYTEALRMVEGSGSDNNRFRAFVYSSRAGAYEGKNDYDRAIADHEKVIRLASADEVNLFAYFSSWAGAFHEKGDYDRAIAAYTEVIKRFGGESAYASSYVSRGKAYRMKGDRARAVADFDEAIRLYTKSIALYPWFAANRGLAYHIRGDYERAIADFTLAIKDNPTHSYHYGDRAEAYEAKGDRAKAIEDYKSALKFGRKSSWDVRRQAKWRERLAALQSAVSPSSALVAPQAHPAPLGRRVALVIGNSSYRAVPKLPNPRNDASEVAAALRAAGFTEVLERYDLGVQPMRDTLKLLEEKAAGADWAVVYYAGHGIEVDGRNYLIPVDAQLKNASDIEDETLPLDRVLARVSVASKLQLVILDACRDNPFAPRMTRPGGLVRNVGTRGLGRVEPTSPNLFIAYSARHGEVALDGSGKNSPYATALVKYLAEPGLELGIFFRRVRVEVLAKTGGKQRPFEYGSLTDDLFFRPIAK